MKFAPEDLAVSISEVEELLDALETSSEELEMGTYTNQIKGHRDKDL